MKTSVKALSLIITLAMLVTSIPVVFSFATGAGQTAAEAAEIAKAADPVPAVDENENGAGGYKCFFPEARYDLPTAINDEEPSEITAVKKSDGSFRLPETKIGDITVTRQPITVLGDPDTDGYYSDVESAAGFLAEKMAARETTVTVPIKIPVPDPDYEESQLREMFDQLFNEVLDGAFEHTGVGYMGDYLQWHYGGAGASGGISGDGEYYFFTINYSISYYTTAEQEAELDERAAELLSSLDIRDASDYEKVKAIYDYMCENIVYDNANLNNNNYKLKYTAYAALINGTAVCQGYANLFYRLALDSGVDARLIAGLGNGGAHGWNIVQIGDLYYDIDSTWGAGFYPDHTDVWFLKSESDFNNAYNNTHVRYNEYATDEFNAAYPMSQTSYVDGTSDPGNNVYVYSYCDASADHVHNFRWQITDDHTLVSEATCTSGDTFKYTCSCGEHSDSTYTFELDNALGHTMTFVDAREATRDEEGNCAYYVCGRCGKFFADEDGTEELTEEQTVIPKLTFDYTSGDLDGDDVTTSDDALYLLYAIFDDEHFGLDESKVDYNGDGQFDSDDAIYLLYHTYFPELYPIG